MVIGRVFEMADKRVLCRGPYKTRLYNPYPKYNGASRTEFYRQRKRLLDRFDFSGTSLLHTVDSEVRSAASQRLGADSEINLETEDSDNEIYLDTVEYSQDDCIQGMKYYGTRCTAWPGCTSTTLALLRGLTNFILYNI